MDSKKWALEVLAKIAQKEIKVAARNKNKIPYSSADGVFNDESENIFWWTNGFWGGMMWQLYHATGDSLYREIAEENEEKIFENLKSYQGMDHDSGFKWLLTAVANYRISGNEKSKDKGLVAANSLAGRYNLAGHFIRAWNDNEQGNRSGWAIIDCMMNLPLLYWAYEELNDPRFLQIAVNHADMAQTEFVRDDGSVNHIVVFDPVTGEKLETLGGQGYAVGSSWTRGQAWALYGFVLSYIHTKNEEYLSTAKRIANYFIANIPASGFIPIDFRQPVEPVWEDSTATVIAACGLIELAKQLSDGDSHIYHDVAVKLLKALDENRCDWNEDTDAILQKCSAAYHHDVHEETIIYGDYYFIEAILKLADKEFFMW